MGLISFLCYLLLCYLVRNLSVLGDPFEQEEEQEDDDVKVEVNCMCSR